MNEQQTFGCVDCGYLAIRDVESRNIREAETDMRRTWKLPLLVNGTGEPRYEKMPFCFVGSVDLRKEIEAKPPADNQEILEVINKLRDQTCKGKFTKWRHGRTPLEHEHMLLNEKMLDDQRVFQKEQAEKQLAWQGQQNSRNRQYQILAPLIALVAGLCINRYIGSPTEPAKPAHQVIPQQESAKEIPVPRSNTIEGKEKVEEKEKSTGRKEK